jgi:phage gp16-like protein
MDDKAERNRLIKLIHVAKRDLALDEDTYRNVLNNLAGKSSSAELTVPQLQQVLEFFRQKGWKPQYRRADQPEKPRLKLSPPTRQKLVKTQIDKIRAMWIDLHRRGIVRSGSELSLDQFVKRVTKVEKTAWLNQKQAGQVILALRKMEGQYADKADKNEQV